MTINTSPTPGAVFTDDELTVFRGELTELLREREALISELDPRAAPHIDIVAWSSTQSARGVVAQINAALLRIETGAFGTCSRCSDPIAPARLEILPYADTCVPCQSGGLS